MLDCLHRYLRNVPPEANLPLTETTAVSPLDGRYARTVIEPALTVFMGSILGWLILSILGPLYDTISKLKI